MPPGPRVAFHAHGIEVEGGLLWLDATEPRSLGVVTHAHGDHVGRHKRIICTPATAELVRKRSGPGSEFLVLRCGEPTQVGDLRLTLLEAGHILGSAMVLLEGAQGSLLYTGDCRPEGGLTCPPADPRPADTLICEATFGRPDHVLPPPSESRAQLLAFVRETLEGGGTPIVLAYSLGKAQEVLTALCREAQRVDAHGAIWNLCAVYRQFGFRFPGCRRISGQISKGAVAVTAPRFLENVRQRSRGTPRVAAITGWSGKAVRPGIDVAIPLSDHADFNGLLQIVESVKPSRVHTLHGYAREFAQELRDRGYDAEAVPGHSGPDEGTVPGMFA